MNKNTPVGDQNNGVSGINKILGTLRRGRAQSASDGAVLPTTFSDFSKIPINRNF